MFNSLLNDLATKHMRKAAEDHKLKEKNIKNCSRKWATSLQTTLKIYFEPGVRGFPSPKRLLQNIDTGKFKKKKLDFSRLPKNQTFFFRGSENFEWSRQAVWSIC